MKTPAYMLLSFTFLVLAVAGLARLYYAIGAADPTATAAFFLAILSSLVAACACAVASEAA